MLNNCTYFAFYLTYFAFHPTYFAFLEMGKYKKKTIISPSQVKLDSSIQSRKINSDSVRTQESDNLTS